MSLHDTRVEDLNWLAETGENAIGAAKRLGLTYASLEKWASKHTPETWQALIARNPRDHNARNGGPALVPRARRKVSA